MNEDRVWPILRSIIDAMVGLCLLSQAMMLGAAVAQTMPEVAALGVVVVAGLTIRSIVEWTNRRDDPRFTKPPSDPL